MSKRFGVFRILHALSLLCIITALIALNSYAQSSAWVQQGPGGATINALVVVPSSPQTLYAGTGYGVYKTINGGGAWNVMNNGLANAPVYSLAVDPMNPLTLYAGMSNSVYKSIDGGASWAYIGLSFESATPSKVNSLAIDPTNPQILYAGTDTGFFKSSNGGGDWSMTGSFPAFSVIIDKTNPQTIFVGNLNNICQSTDGGITWNFIALPPGIVPAFAVDPVMPLTIYAGTIMGVIKSTDGGNNWTFSNTGLTSAYVNTLAIDPQSLQTLYAGTREGVFKSTDGGSSWSAFNTGISALSVLSLAIDPLTPNRIYAGTLGGGVFVHTTTSSSPQITISTNPPGRSFLVDGVVYTSATAFSWTTGSTHSVSVSSFQQTTNARYTFSGWSDGGDITHIITAPDGAATYVATFLASYRLSTSANPTYGGSVTFQPASADGYYASGSSIQLTATPNFSYSFSYWDGNISDTVNPKTVTISAATTFTAFFALASSHTLDLNPGGVIRFNTTASTAPIPKPGYAKLTVNSGATPYGTAVFIYKQNGITVSEAGVPASPPTTRARVFIDYRSRVFAIPGRSSSGMVDINTGIGLVNYGSATANITYTLRNTDGSSIAIGHGTLAVGHHLAKFIDQFTEAAPDFILPPGFPFASLDIVSDQPLSVMALRMTMNQRNEPLFTTTPVADLTQALTSNAIYFPQLADGVGYTTSLVLLNTSNSTERGTIYVYDDNGLPLIVQQAGGSAASSFQYSIPAGGAFRFQTDGGSSIQKAGWVQVIPSYLYSLPIGSGVFSYNPGDTLLTESGIPSALPTTHARIYVDLTQNHNTGLAIANLSNAVSAFAIQAFQTDGTTPIGYSAGLQLPAYGHTGKFATQFISGLPADFTGVLDISAAAPFVALTLRSLSNERGDFLLTTFPIADVTRAAPSPVVFPHIANGGGYTTQIILISPGGAANTSLVLFDDSGAPFEAAN
jgi:photosystem II stability/assembly factor-like uncharacterized protein